MPPTPPSGFAEFVTSSIPALQRFGHQLTGDSTAADDLVQAALVKAWERWDHIRRADDPVVYVRRIMLNRHLTWWHRRGRREVLARPPDVALPSGEDAIVDRHALIDALASLTPKQRAVIVLRFFEDMSEADTADLLGCSRGTVKSQTSKSLARLRELLAPPKTADECLTAPTRRVR